MGTVAGLALTPLVAQVGSGGGACGTVSSDCCCAVLVVAPLMDCERHDAVAATKPHRALSSEQLPPFLACWPALVQHVGWAPTFTLFGLVGMAAAAACSLGLPAEGSSSAAVQRQPAAARPAGQGSSLWSKPSWELVQHMGMLCFTHSVIRQARGAGFCMHTAAHQIGIGWSAGGDVHRMRVHESCASDRAAGGRSGLRACTFGSMPDGLALLPPRSWNFFILQSWLPTLLASLGLSHLPTIGLLSSLPWLVRCWGTGCRCLCRHAPADALCCMETRLAHVCWLALLKTWSSEGCPRLRLPHVHAGHRRRVGCGWRPGRPPAGGAWVERGAGAAGHADERHAGHRAQVGK